MSPMLTTDILKKMYLEVKSILHFHEKPIYEDALIYIEKNICGMQEYLSLRKHLLKNEFLLYAKDLLI